MDPDGQSRRLAAPDGHHNRCRGRQAIVDGGAASYPFPKVGGGGVVMAGGTGGPPIEPIRDITAAGWNTARTSTRQQRPVHTTSHRAGGSPGDPVPDADVGRRLRGRRPPGAVIPHLRRLPETRHPRQRPEREVRGTRQAIATDLVALVGGTGVPANADLQDVSAPGVAVSAKVIRPCKELPADEAGVFAGRLASEVAIARTIEEAFAIRRLLISGRRVPEVMSTNRPWTSQ